MSLEYRDTITITISYILFWLIILALIIYPIFRLRKILKRIESFEKNKE